jgi:hypothetical protein
VHLVSQYIPEIVSLANYYIDNIGPFDASSRASSLDPSEKLLRKVNVAGAPSRATPFP